MNPLKRILKNEPVMVAGLVEAIIVLAIAFGTGISPEQMAAIMTVTTILLSLVARAMSTPVDPQPKR